MIEPLRRDDAFLEDVEAARLEAGVQLWWLGQSGFLVLSEASLLLFDPYLSDSLTERYAKSDRPHVRLTRRVIAPDRLRGIDVVASTHSHTDHLDADTLRPVLRANPAVSVVVPEANRPLAAERLGVPPERLAGMDEGTELEAAGFYITGVPAAHETIERDEEGHCRFLGYVVQTGLRTIYHSGDTVLYDGMAERLRSFSPDVALLPINGRDPERGVAGNLDGPEAARLAHDLRAGLAVPCHYDMFEFNTASPDAFVSECERLGQPHRLLRAGERLSL